MYLAPGFFAEQFVEVHIDPAFVQIGSCTGVSLLNHAREANTDRTFPVKMIDNLLNHICNSTWCGGLWGRDPVSLGFQFSFLCMYNGSLHAGAPNVNSENLF